MRFSKDGFHLPTPKVWVKIGNSLLGAGLTIATFAVANDYKIIGIVAVCLGGLGKFISTFFVDDEPVTK